MAECGCRIVKIDGDHYTGTVDREYIEYCPLHAAAEKMELALLEISCLWGANGETYRRIAAEGLPPREERSHEQVG